MERSDVRMVDVRDMLCAQALAVVAHTMDPLPPGARVEVRYSTEDVRRDLVAWATERGYRVRGANGSAVQIEKS